MYVVALVDVGKKNLCKGPRSGEEAQVRGKICLRLDTEAVS